MARKDFRTANSIQQVYFSDFTNNMDKNPVTGYLARTTNEETAKQMLRNLILTIQGERFFQPFNGSRVYDLLFEPADNYTMDSIRSSIEESINNELPFIKLTGIEIKDRSDINSYSITIGFTIIGIDHPISMLVVLKRIR